MKARTQSKSTQPISFRQLVALALDIAEYRLQSLLRIYQEDDELGEDVSDVDYAVRVGLERIEHMRDREFEDYSKFDFDWFGVAAVLKLALKSLQQLDTYYCRSLQSACDFFEQMRNSVEFVDLTQRGRIKLTS